MRKKNTASGALGNLGRATLAALCVLAGCLNPRPEELPSADPSRNVPGELGPDRELAVPNGAAAPNDADESIGTTAAGDEPPSPEAPPATFAPPAPEDPGAAGAPEVPDAGADAGAEGLADAG